MLYLTTTNNNAFNVTINFVLNKIVYEFQVNNSLTLLKNLLSKNYSCFQLIKREFVEKIITFVNVIKKLRYNVIYIDIEFVVDDYVYLCLYNNYIIFNFTNRKLNQQQIDFFKILKKIDILVYRFELSLIMQIYLIISIVQLKSTLTFKANFYCRFCSNTKNSLFVQLKNDNDSKNSIKVYEIEQLLNRRIIIIDRINYLIK